MDAVEIERTAERRRAAAVERVVEGE